MWKMLPPLAPNLGRLPPLPTWDREAAVLRAHPSPKTFPDKMTHILKGSQLPSLQNPNTKNGRVSGSHDSARQSMDRTPSLSTLRQPPQCQFAIT